MEKFALFDANMALVKDAKDVSRYFAESIMNIYGMIVSVNLAEYQGMSAKETAMEILKKNGLKEDEIEERLDRLLEDLPYSYYNEAWSDRVLVIDGAERLLGSLRNKDIGIGMATGEPQRIAKMRLDKVKLSSYFSFGSYAEDGISPKEIINTALNRASAELGLQSDEGILFSAFPRFISAARESGMYAVGVAGARFSTAELISAGANEAAQSLKEEPKILRQL